MYCVVQDSCGDKLMVWQSKEHRGIVVRISVFIVVRCTTLWRCSSVPLLFLRKLVFRCAAGESLTAAYLEKVPSYSCQASFPVDQRLSKCFSFGSDSANEVAHVHFVALAP